MNQQQIIRRKPVRVRAGVNETDTAADAERRDRQEQARRRARRATARAERFLAFLAECEV